MTLLDVQTALARLFTDGALRARFLTDPVEVCSELALSSDERESLLTLDRQQIERFAGSLRRKRRGSVRGLLPATATLLCARAEELFAEYADQSAWPGGSTADALGFLRHAARHAGPGSGLLRDTMRCEQAMLEILLAVAGDRGQCASHELDADGMPRSTSRMAVLAVDYDLEALYPRLVRGEPVAAAREPSFLLVGRATGSTANRLKRINESTAKLLALCDGSRTTQNVLDEAAASLGLQEQARDAFEAEARGFLRQLLANGLLTV